MKINHLYIWFVLFARRFLTKFYLGHIVIHSFKFNYYFIFCFDAVLVLSDMDQFTFLIEASNSYRSRSHCWSCFGLTHGDTWGHMGSDTWGHLKQWNSVMPGRWLCWDPDICYHEITNPNINLVHFSLQPKNLKCTSLAIQCQNGLSVIIRL